MNEFELLIVQEDLERKGYTNYDLRPGNDCIWASIRCGSAWLDFYYIFRNGQLADIQID